MKKRVPLCLFGMVWCILFIVIQYHTTRILALTDQSSYQEETKVIVDFYTSNWKDISSLNRHYENPIQMHYAVYDNNGNLQVASRRDMQYTADYTAYAIQENGQRKGEVRIYDKSYFLNLCSEINAHQAVVKQASMVCFVALVLFLGLEWYQCR